MTIVNKPFIYLSILVLPENMSGWCDLGIIIVLSSSLWGKKESKRKMSLRANKWLSIGSISNLNKKEEVSIRVKTYPYLGGLPEVDYDLRDLEYTSPHPCRAWIILQNRITTNWLLWHFFSHIQLNIRILCRGVDHAPCSPDPPHENASQVNKQTCYPL